MSAAAAESRFVLVKLAPDQSGKMDWINVMHHDLAAALRSMRYLTQKAKASYNSADLRAAQILASIDQHLATLERLKADVVDTIFPVEG